MAISFEGVRLEDLGPCVEWQGSKTGAGYPRYWCREEKKHKYEHRRVAGAQVGEIVRHRCDNPSCVRPDHLELGTQQDNVDDMYRRGRDRTCYDVKGHSPRLKLSREDADYIRSCGLPTKELAAQFKVDRTTIQKLRAGTLNRRYVDGHSEYPARESVRRGRCIKA